MEGNKMKTPHIVHMTDIQRCSLDDLEKFMKEAKEDIRSNGDYISMWMAHGDSNAFRANKGLTKPFAKAAGIPRPELRWIASVIAGDEGALPFPENRPIDSNSEIYNTLADVLKEGEEMTKERIELMKNMAEAQLTFIRGNSEPVYSWWAKYGHRALVDNGMLKPVEELFKEAVERDAFEPETDVIYVNGSILYSAFSFPRHINDDRTGVCRLNGNRASVVAQYCIPWADSGLAGMIAEYAGVTDIEGIEKEKAVEARLIADVNSERFRKYIVEPRFERTGNGNVRLTINMHGAPTTELSAMAMRYKGKKGKAVEQEALVNAMFRRLAMIQNEVDIDVRVLYGHDGVEAFVDQEAELCGVPFRGIHLVEEGPAHYENLATGEITMSGSAKTMHDKTVAKYEATQTKG